MRDIVNNKISSVNKLELPWRKQ